MPELCRFDPTKSRTLCQISYIKALQPQLNPQKRGYCQDCYLSVQCQPKITIVPRTQIDTEIPIKTHNSFLLLDWPRRQTTSSSAPLLLQQNLRNSANPLKQRSKLMVQTRFQIKALSLALNQFRRYANISSRHWRHALNTTDSPKH